MANDDYTGEQLFSLPDGRTLAYDQNGDRASTTVVLFFHGIFGVGRCPKMSPYLRSRGVHYVTPTVQGWGESSPIPPNQPFARQFAQDIQQLLVHLHPNESDLKLYVCGGSYGTVFAQMLYGAPYDVFPMGQHLVRCLIIGPFSPFMYDKDAYKSMTWPNYLMVGPPARLPFKLIPRLLSWVMSRKLATVEGSEALVNQIIIDKLTEEEKGEFRKWCQFVGYEEGEYQKGMAAAMRKSVSKTWDGYFAVTDISAGDWGFNPSTLDEEHAKCKIVILASKQDDMAPIALARYLDRTYPNSQLIEGEGGHASGMYRMEEAWATILGD